MQARLQIRKAPDKLLASLHDVQFVCPVCRGELEILSDGYNCGKCEKTYLLHDGIPDFRVFPCPYLSFQEDRERTEIILSVLEKYKLEELLQYYWSFSDITPEPLRQKFIRSVMLGAERARHKVEKIAERTSRTNVRARRILEIGSGAGGFLAAAAGEFEQVIGTDIGMRWLHLSRRRFIDLGIPVPALVCCCAEFLPFADGSFDLVAATSTIEFVKDQERVISEAERVLRAGGVFYVNTVNRYSLARDPYSNLWGVGFVPRRLQAKYVYLRCRAIYKTRLLSFIELKRLTHSLFGSLEITLPEVSPGLIDQLSWFRRQQVRLYVFLKNFRLFSTALRYIGPEWDVLLKKGLS